MSKWFSSIGSFGNIIANLLALLSTNWAVVMTVLTAIGTSVLATFQHWTQDSAVLVGIKVFLIVLWIIIGLLWLKDRKRPVITKPTPRIEWGLAWSGFSWGFEP